MSVNNLNSQSCQTLADWLCYIEQSHPIDKIELGLARVQQVAARAELASLPGTVILIAGTNGKGTTARTLEQLLLAQGYSVGVYSSPHLMRFNERLRINNVDVADHNWLAAFALVEQLREDIPLTYFEFTTLVAFAILRQQQPDFCLIEVGLGGRLDATNIISPDISVITTIDLDHQDWLGSDRYSIAKEKAGVFRAGKMAICGEVDPPASIRETAEKLGTTLLQLNGEFHYSVSESKWDWQGEQQRLTGLYLPLVPVQNVATSLAVLEQLNALPAVELLNTCLSKLQLPGRMQKIQERPDILVDVAHNPQSAKYLATQLLRLKPRYSRVMALVGMLKDKDIAQSLQPLLPLVDQWHLVSLGGGRGATSDLLYHALQQISEVEIMHVEQHTELSAAFPAILKTLQADDLLVIFGSFVTVSAILALQQEAL